jgi:hypothetical protein
MHTDKRMPQKEPLKRIARIFLSGETGRENKIANNIKLKINATPT